MRNALLLALLPATVALTGCGHKKHAAMAPPPPPALLPGVGRVNPAPSAPAIFGAETGIASWYGHPYHGRKAADGEIYDMETLVAAHRTLPFNTWVRVVNLRNNKVVEVRIIDRGPFIDGRIIDLSHAAANAIDLVGPGVGPVRLEVIRAPSSSAFAPPAPAASAPTVPTRAAAQAAAPASGIPASAAPQTYIPAAFAVQIGIFFDRASAERVRAGMAARYGSARIVPREGGHEMWRVLVGSEATEIAATAISERIRQESGERNAFVVRLDSY